MDSTFLIGLTGSLILLIGSAWPAEKVKLPYKSTKNWLFGIGSWIMLVYAIVGYLSWGAVFFIFMEILVAISCILMMLPSRDRLNSIIIGGSGIVLIIWSLFLFQNYRTILFVAGMAILGIGFASRLWSQRRNIALTLGSIFVAIFSYTEASRIFFGMNTFFALFSLYYTIKGMREDKKK